MNKRDRAFVSEEPPAGGVWTDVRGPSRAFAAPHRRARWSCRAWSVVRPYLVAATAAALLLSPGARDACAGCCGDGAPVVAAPLAAGIAPVHSCCQAPEPPQGCCGALREIDVCHDRTAASGSASERSACPCQLGGDDGLPPDAARPRLGQRTLDGACGVPQAACLSPTAPECCRSTLTAMIQPPLGRPARILYGVWRN